MRITLVISALTAGGAERVMSGMANYWSADQHELTLITVWPATIDWYRLDPRVKRVAINSSLILPSSCVGDALRNNLGRIGRLRHALKTSLPNVVISFGDTTNVLTLIASRGLGIPVVVSERTNPQQHSVGFFWRILRAFFYRQANAVVVQSNAVRDWARKLAGKEAIYVIPNFIRSPGPSSEDISQSPGAGRTVIAMGRLGKEKGFDLLVKAFDYCLSKHTDWKLVILGEGPERSRLQQLVADLGLQDRVQLAGLVQDPASILKGADLFVLSSRYEGFPNALLEAMACGLAVISTDCDSGPRDIIRNGVDGVLVRPDDVGSLAIGMDLLMGDEGERQRLGAKALEVTERFSVKSVMKQWEGVLLKVSGDDKVLLNGRPCADNQMTMKQR